jgi:hypothetical protein
MGSSAATASSTGPLRISSSRRWAAPPSLKKHRWVCVRSSRPSVCSGERLAETGDEVGSPVAQRKRERLVMQDGHAGVA